MTARELTQILNAMYSMGNYVINGVVYVSRRNMENILRGHLNEGEEVGPYSENVEAL